MNRKRTVAGLVLAALVAVSYGIQGQDAERRQGDRERGASGRVTRAVAVLLATEESGVRGVVRFTQKGDSVEITGRIRGLEPGKHGFHIHQYGDLTDRRTGKSAGGHYNPTGQPHGRPEDQERHVGDLGNIEADERGRARISMRDSVLQLNGPHSIIGRSVVVHADPDEFTQPSGDAGKRLAVGVIGIAQPEDESE